MSHHCDQMPRQETRQYAIPAMEMLLADGGDARIERNSNGVNKYGCSSIPQPDGLSYASSTASTISAVGYAACTRLYRRLENASRTETAAVTYAREMTRIRRELISLCDLDSLPGVEVIFGASGTDLHLFTSLLLCKADASLLVIMAEASETGSDVPVAMRGRHFSNRTALGVVTAGKEIDCRETIEVAVVKARLDNGDLRPASLVDLEAEALVVSAIGAGRRVLLILTDVSKTGLVIPSPACALALKRRFSSMVDVLVDACQFRISNATTLAYLEQDFLLAMTGSKFVTGPSFSGALLVPQNTARRLHTRVLPSALSNYSARADWPSTWAARLALIDTANYGLLLRWEAALATLRAFHSLCEADICTFLETFAASIQERIGYESVFELLPFGKVDRRPIVNQLTWDHIPTIFPFLMCHPESGTYLDKDEISGVYEHMKGQLGQPVACGIRQGLPISALRLCVDMRLIVDALSKEGRGSDAVIANALRVLDKAAALAGQQLYWDKLNQQRTASAHAVFSEVV